MSRKPPFKYCRKLLRLDTDNQKATERLSKLCLTSSTNQKFTVESAAMGTLIHDMPPTILKAHDVHSRPLLIDTATANLQAPPAGQLSHSPLESPPILKKRLRRLGSSLLAGTLNVRDLPPELMAVLKHQGSTLAATQAYLATHQGRQYSKEEADLPTMTRSSSCPPRARVNSTSHPGLSRSGSILKEETRRSLRVPSSPGKRVHFENEVTVHLMGEEGHICTQCEQLQVMPRVSRRDFIARNLRRQRSFHIPSYSSPSSASYTDSSSDNVVNNKRVSSEQTTDLLDSNYNTTNNVYMGHRTPAITSTDNATPNNINISFEQDAEKGTKLKFVVFLGLDYSPDNVVVKANMNGNRIRVLATSSVISSDGQAAMEFNERYLLPMNVDPFSVEARLDTKGYLTVVAPLMTLARRQELSVKDKPAASS